MLFNSIKYARIMMKAELHFFAMPDEVNEILMRIENKVDKVVDRYRLIIGDCEIRLTAPVLTHNVLLVGSISFNTGTVDHFCADKERAKKVYRDMRQWFKKSYSNKLNTYQLDNPEKVSLERNYWISPAAVAWKKLNSDKHIIKLSATNKMGFALLKKEITIAQPIPVESSKVRGHG